MERNKRLKAADKCASRYTNENEARIARTAFMLGCEFEAQGEVVKGVILETEEDHWKPSEEQMEALKCAVEDVAKFSKRGGRQVGCRKRFGQHRKN